jgi:hypothetical protein
MSAGSWLLSVFATKTTADDWLRYHRALRDFGTYLVIVGVIAETLIDELWEIDTPPLLRGIRATTLLKTKAAWLKRGVMIFVGIIMVGGGIGLEMWQGGKADDVADQIRTNLQRRLVSISPRVWLLDSDDVRVHLKQALRPFAGQKIKLTICTSGGGDFGEKADFAIPFGGDILKSAGWNSTTRSEPCGGHGMGVAITGPPLKPTVDAANALNSALQKAGFIASEQPVILLSPKILKVPPDTVVLFIFGRT